MATDVADASSFPSRSSTASSRRRAEIVQRLELGAREDSSASRLGAISRGHVPRPVSDRAKERGRDQLGTLGGGNHFLEIQRVQAIFDSDARERSGSHSDQITASSTRDRAASDIRSAPTRARDGCFAGALRDHAPRSPARLRAAGFAEGERYFAAMCAAANSRSPTVRCSRIACARCCGGGARAVVHVVYDVATTSRRSRSMAASACVCTERAPRAPLAWRPRRARGVSRDRPTRAHPGAWAPPRSCWRLRRERHLVLERVPRRGPDHEPYGREGPGEGGELRKELAHRGIVVRCPSNAELAEEAPIAYKDVERVVDVVHRAGVARKVARLVPLGVLKG